MFVTILSIVLAVNLAAGDDNAEYCSETIKSGFEKVLEMAANSPNVKEMKFPAKAPFKECQFTGVDTLTIINASSKKIGDCKTIEHYVQLKFSIANVSCGCELPPNPIDTIKGMKASMKEKNGGIPCNVSDDKLKQYNPQKVDPESLVDIKGLATCDECAGFIKPKVPTLGSMPSIKAPEPIKGFIMTYWRDPVIELGFCLDVATNVMKPCKARVVTDDLSGIKVECVGSVLNPDGTDPMDEPCKCIAKASVLQAMLLQIMNIFFPCYCDGGLEKMQQGGGEKPKGAEELAKTMFQEISCKEVYCN